jgi:hypothetical protein
MRLQARSRFGKLGLVLALLAGLSACPGEGSKQQPGPGPQPPPAKGTCDQPIPSQLTPEPQKVKGYLVNACGQPIPSAKVIVRNSFAGPSDSPLTVTPNSDGLYTQNLPSVGVFQAFGEVRTVYDGLDYCLWVKPFDGSTSFAAKDGGVQNFVWKISGESADSKPGDRRYAGGGIWLESTQIDFNYNVSSDSILFLEFKPLMPLIDGSTGKDVMIQVPWNKRTLTATTPELNGLPIGKYQIFAAIQFPNDAMLYKVYLRLDDGKGSPFTDSLTAKFGGDRQGGPVNCGFSPTIQLGLSFTAGN